MPKGKPKAKYADLYEEEDPEEVRRRKMAPQAAAHRRGGTHRVKDADLTGTRFDTMNYQELTVAAKELKVWYKDIRKADMIRKCAEAERKMHAQERVVQRENEKKREELRKEKEKKLKEKNRRAKEKAAREKRRVAGYDVSTSEDENSDSDGVPALDTVGHGQIVSDIDSYESTGSSETPIKSALSPIFPDRKLRLFEWPHADMPSPNPPRSPWSPSGRKRSNVFDERLPRKVTYAVVKLTTTISGETIEVPGRNYPEDVAPDHVPLLSQHTRDCARNGVMVSTLRRAVIEKASDWAARTQIQWWNGRMFFYMPPRTSKNALIDVYAKWNKKKANDKQRPVKNGKVTKAPNKRGVQQKKKDKMDMMIDIYNATEHRTPMCYVPSYLDYPLQEDDVDIPLGPDNLFYVRFPGMDLPHYYFWTFPGDWEDPTIPNSEWEEAIKQDNEDQRTAAARHEQPLRETQIRVKKPTVPRKFQRGQKQPKTSKYKATLWNIERELYNEGYGPTLYKYRAKWLENEKDMEWREFGREMPLLYPSGKLPEMPPLTSQPPSIAEKLAAIEVPSKHRPVSPLRGNEPWTRDDDAYWAVVDMEPPAETEEDIQMELLRSASIPGFSPRVSSRRPSNFLLPIYNRKFDEWLEGLSPSIPPPAAPIALESPMSVDLRAIERDEWDELFAKHAQAQMLQAEPNRRVTRSASRTSHSPTMPKLFTRVEDMPISELKWNINNLMNDRRRSEEQCRICLRPLVKGDLRVIQQHYQSHYDDSNSICPFCEMDWNMLDPEWKAAHIFSHSVDESTYRRQSSNYPLYSLPTTTARRSSRQHQPRRTSKVHFSPKVVERRIAYNDITDTGMDADVSSIATISPQKSSLRRATTSRKLRTSALKHNTESKITKTSVDRRFITRGRKGPKPAPDQTYHEPSSLSDHVSSPELHLVHRYDPYNDNAAWNPKRHSESGSDHIPSPHLPHVVRHPWYHPNAQYDPRRYSKTSTESLEYHNGRKGLRTRTRTAKAKAKVAVERAKANATAGDRSAKRRRIHGSDAHRIAIGETPQILQTLAPTEPEREGRNSSTVSNASSESIGRRTRSLKSLDLGTTEISKAKRGKKRKAVELGTERKGRSSVSTSPAGARVSSGSSTHSSRPKRLSTSSPVSPKAIQKQRRELDFGPGTCRRSSIVSPTSRKLSATSQSSRASKKRKVSNDEITALHRRPSDQEMGADFVHFINEPLFEDHDEDVLTGNPFVPPVKGKATTSKGSKVTTKIAKGTRTKKSSQRTSPNEIAPQKRGTATVTELAGRRMKKAGKTTISGRQLVEPLAIAPAKRLGKSQAKLKAATASTVDSDLLDSLSPVSKTEASSSTSKKRATHDAIARGRRSSAPTPSPSLSLPNSSGRTFLATPISTVSSTKLATASIKSSLTARKASYDVPFSELRPIVPPNTPAIHLIKDRRASASSTSTELDVGELNDKISKVKTTRGGLVREVPGGVAQGRARAQGKKKRAAKVQQLIEDKMEGKKAKDGNGKGKPKSTKNASPKSETTSPSSPLASAPAAKRKRSEVDFLATPSKSLSRLSPSPLQGK